MTLTARSYAKINWMLRVLDRRADGMHEVRTVYQTISLHDTLRFEEQRSGITLRTDDPALPAGETNLVVQAARRLAEFHRTGRGVSIELLKRIPTEAGLGGGSSNAAVTLLSLDRLWNLETPREVLARIAADLGSDVPFFLWGGTAFGVSRGEEVYPLQDAPASHLVVAMSSDRVATKEAYARLDGLLTRYKADRKMPFAFFAPDGTYRGLSALANDFEEVILPLYPGIQRTREALRLAGAEAVLLSGSGASVFGVFENGDAARMALLEIRPKVAACFACRSVTREEYWATLFEN